MLTRPPNLSDDAVAQAVSKGWGLTVASLRYLAVGFGSHHWEVVDAQGTKWFSSVDDFDGFDRLHAALSTARDLRAAGLAFVIAPRATTEGTPLTRIGSQYAVALYPHVDGESYAYGDFRSQAHRHGVLDLLVAVHSVAPAVTRHARRDDFVIPLRAELERSLMLEPDGWGRGPYGRPAAMLLAENAQRIRDSLERYDNLTREVRDTDGPARAVLTHGEPHPGNTMLTPNGWVLIDWDTVLVAAPERDLWSIDPGDGSIFEAYMRATGTQLLPSALALYRIRWDLADIAICARMFRDDHTGSADEAASWDELRTLVARLPT